MAVVEQAEAPTLIEQYEAIRADLSDNERIARLELVCLTLAREQAELVARFDSALGRLEAALGRVEAEGPAALLGSLIRPRRPSRGRHG